MIDYPYTAIWFGEDLFVVGQLPPSLSDVVLPTVFPGILYAFGDEPYILACAGVSLCSAFSSICTTAV